MKKPLTQRAVRKRHKKDYGTQPKKKKKK